MIVCKKNQIVALMLVILIVAAGYLQYVYKKSSISAQKDNARIGDAVYVEDNPEENLAKSTTGKIDKPDPKNNEKKTDEQQKKSESGNQVLEASKTASNFFAQARLDRETSRSKNAELLEGLTKDEKSDKDIKTKAYNDLLKLVSLSEKEAKIESLLKKAGFEEAIVLFADNGGVDVIVKAPQLTTQQVSQICDIVSRHANVNYDKIIVSNKY